MKSASRILSFLILVTITSFLASCKKDDPDKKTDEETQFEKLKGTWQIVTANDGDDRTNDFPNLVLTLGGNYVEGGTYNYSFTGTRPDPSPWPASGTWKFGNPKTTQVIRDPGDPGETTMNYIVNGTELTIEFSVPESSQGWPGGTSRIKSVSGNWTFTFTKL